MRRLVAFFIKNGLFGDILTFFVVVLGIYSATQIRREIFPNVNFDVLSIVTLFPGGTAEETEKLITNPLEQELKELDGVKRFKSVSIEGQSRVIVVLDPDQTTETEAKEDIKDILDKLNDLPEGSEDPIVFSAETKINPIIEVTIFSDEMNELELRMAAKELEEVLESVPGVAKIAHRGLRDLEYRVEADLDKLRSLRVSLEEVIMALKNQNKSVPGGVIESLGGASAKERLVRTIGDFKKIEDIENTVIRANDLTKSIRVKDVAKVSYGLKKSDIITRTNGRSSLSLTVLKKEKADVIDLVDLVTKKGDEFSKSYKKDLKITYINDYSYYVKRRLSILLSNFTFGMCFVLILLPLLIPWRFAAIVSLGEPFAFLGTVAILYASGNSINLISMIALIIVSGILVDDSIVVTENAVRLISSGKSPQEAAYRGTLQIIPPITASVLTTCMAFIPMAFVSGIFGKFIVEIPIAVITALGVSLLETFFILPAHVAHWIKPEQLVIRENPNMILRITNKTQKFWDDRVVVTYEKVIRFLLARRYKVLFGTFGLFIFSLLIGWHVLKVVLFPPEGIEIFYIRTEAPVGTSLAAHAKAIEPIEKILNELPDDEVDDFSTTVGLVQQDPNDPNTRRGAEFSQIAVFLSPETDRNRMANEIIEDVKNKVGSPKEFSHISYDRINPGPPVGKPISIGIRGDTYDVILPAVEDMKKFLKSQDGVLDITDNFFKGKEEVQVIVDPAKAASSGVNVSNIGMTVRAAYEGIEATSVKDLKEEADVTVSLAQNQRANLSSLENLLIPNPQGRLVELSSMAVFRTEQSITSFEHEDNLRQVRISGDVDAKKVTALEVAARAREFVPELLKSHPKVSVYFGGGEEQDTMESLVSLGKAFMLAVFGIFLILVLLFKNLLQPLLTLLTIPLGIIAVIWAFFIHGLPLSFMGFLGIIALSGVIVNNAIVFVDFVNQRRDEGQSTVESIIEAARTRIRPIFLTTVTTIVGILPTAYGLGGLDKFVVPIAMALGWGLMFGSLLTAFVFPVALAAVDDIQKRKWLSKPVGKV